MKKKIFIVALISSLGLLFLYGQNTKPSNKKENKYSITTDSKTGTGLDSLRELLAIAKTPDDILRRLINLAEGFRNQTTLYDSCEYYANKALILSRRLNNKINEANSLFLIGEAYRVRWLWDKKESTSAQAILSYGKALEIYKELKESNRVALTLNQIGNCYVAQYNYSKAIILFNEALDIFRKDKKNYEKYTDCLEMIASCYSEMGEKDKALANYTEALKKYMEKNELEKIAEINVNIGNIYVELEKYEDALEYYNKSFEYYTNISSGDKNQNYTKNINGIGVLNMHLKNYPLAKEFFQTAIKIDSVNNSQFGLADNYMSVGELYKKIYEDSRDIKDIDNSIGYATKGLKLNKELDRKNEEVKNLCQLAVIYKAGGHEQKAQDMLIDALQKSEEIGDNKLIALSCAKYGAHNMGLNIDTALKYNKKAKEAYSNVSDKRGIARSNQKLGDCYQNLADKPGILVEERKTCLSEAKEYFEQSRQGFGLTGLEKEEIESMYKLVEAYIGLDECKSVSQITKEANDKQSKRLYKWYSMKKRVSDKSPELQKRVQLLDDSNKNLTRDNIEKTKIIYVFRDSLRIKSLESDSIRARALEKDLEIVLLANKNIQNKIDSTNNSISLTEAHNLNMVMWCALAIAVIIICIIVSYSRRIGKTNLKLEAFSQDLAQKNQEIEQSNLELAALNDTKTKLFSIISHDLKGPVYSFNNLSQFLSEYYYKFTDEEKKQHIDTLKVSSGNVAKLLENLLSWARLQTENMRICTENINISELLNKESELHKQALSEKNIKLQNTANQKINVFSDAETLSTVVRNLLSNAIKFTPDGGKISISATEAKDFVEISIADSGIGIKKEDKEKIFNVGIKHSTIGTNNEKGTGLGLNLCKEFLEKINGSIRFESELGKGTTFYVRLPKEETEII